VEKCFWSFVAFFPGMSVLCAAKEEEQPCCTLLMRNQLGCRVRNHAKIYQEKGQYMALMEEAIKVYIKQSTPVAYPGLSFGRGVTPGIFFGGGGSTNSVEDRGQRERRSGGGSPLVRGSAQFANEWNPYSDYVVTDYFPRNWKFGSDLLKPRNFGRGLNRPNPPRYATEAHSSRGKRFIVSLYESKVTPCPLLVRVLLTNLSPPAA
jgi:hypothetical protein